MPSATRARWATTACRRRPTASSSPRARNSASKAFEAGMRYAYLQFDGIGNDANSHRQVGNLFDVKLRAIENMHEAGIEIVLVTTIVNNVNNDQVGADREVRDGESEEDLLRVVPAGFVHRPRRRHHSGTPHAPALHAVASGQGRERAGGQSRADARLVPDFVDQHVRGFCRSGARPGSAVGLGLLRLPPELRRGHGADDQQGNQGVGAGAALPQRART